MHGAVELCFVILLYSCSQISAHINKIMVC